MIFEIILFVGACLVWQGIKDRARGGRPRGKPVVRIAGFTRAECGCLVQGDRVTTPCQAHREMLGS